MTGSLFRFWHWCRWKLRLFLAWSFIFRFLACRWKYKSNIESLPQLTSEKAQEMMDVVQWKKDLWHTLWDALDSPFRFHHFASLNGSRQPKCCNDCDEFAYWGTCVVANSFFLNVAWIENGKWCGHNVCLICNKNGLKPTFIHIGNWGKSKTYFDLSNLIKSIIGKKQLIGWAIMTRKRKVILQSRKNLPTSKNVKELISHLDSRA